MMNFPKEAADACDRLAAKHQELAKGSDDDRRRLTRMIVEQIAFWRQGSGDAHRWGCKKRAGVGDEFQSKDSIAYVETDGSISVWDWQNGATRGRGIGVGNPPSHANLPTNEAAFMPVTPTDHLGGAAVIPSVTEPEQPPVEPKPQPSVNELQKALESFMEDVRAKLGDMHDDVRLVKGELEAVKHAALSQPPLEIATKFPAYVGKVTLPVFGERSFRLEPERK